MKLTRREIFALIASTSIISSVLYVVYFYKPIAAETNKLMVRLSELNANAKASQNIDVELEKLVNELNSLESVLGISNRRPLEGAEQAEIILFFQRLIEPFGIEKAIQFEDIEDYGTYKAAQVKVCLETDRSNLRQILKGVEQSPWKNRVEKLYAVARNKDNSSLHPYDMDVELIIGFYYP